jgi:hypothetical protein
VFGLSTPRGFGRSLTSQEKSRLFDSMKLRSNVPLTMDISFTKTTLTRPETVKKRNVDRMEETKKLREKTKNNSITIRGVGIALPDGSDISLAETRTWIDTERKLRSDTTIFANLEKTETWSETTEINTGYEKDSPSYLIDHKLKQCQKRSGKRWSGHQVLRFGKTDEFIALDIALFCDPNLPPHVKERVNKNLLYDGTADDDGKVVDEIECINLKKGKPIYRISLYSDDWRICRRIVRYNDISGLPSKIVEYRNFGEAKGSRELFPRLVITRYFDEKGKEEKVETINVTNVTIGLPISEDTFKTDVPDGYGYYEMKFDPPHASQQR